MIRVDTDVAILGAGFAGSVLALMLSRSREVVLIERGRHPRFALGESSTPLANLALEEIAAEYELPWLAPLAEYGSWKREYPDLVCGLKRGFTFVEHHRGQPFVPDAEHRNELLVTASPRDEVADTQWLRADFDHFLVNKVIEAGIAYHDRTELECFEPGPTWRMSGRREDEEIEITSKFVVDATGAGGSLARALRLPTQELSANSWAVYSHFVEMDRWEDIVAELGGRVEDYPYHADDAALHHVLDDGWMYVLRFDTGLVSAGFLIDGTRLSPNLTLSAEQEWHRLLDQYPGVARHLRGARAVRPIERTRRLQRFIPTCAGDNWAMLAPAAYTMDALFSTGNAHALMTVRRLVALLSQHREREAHAHYAAALCEEVHFIDTLVSTAYKAMRCFPLFAAWSMYYFAGAIAAEERRRGGRSDPDERFLSSHLPWFREAVMRASNRMTEITHSEPSPEQIAAFERQVAADIAPINTTGLAMAGKKNLYSY